MKIATVILNYPPLRRIGAELYDHAIHKELIKAGHTVDVFTSEEGKDTTWEYEGVTVNPTDNKDYDLIITHIDCRQKAFYFKRTRKLNVPIIGILHNFGQHALMDESLYTWEGIIYNSTAGYDMSKNKLAKKQVLIPFSAPVGRSAVSKGTKYTQINLNTLKGGERFWQIAKSNPDLEFIAVKGGWGKQVIPSVIPDNVELVEHTEDLTEVWENTRGLILLADKVESWAMVASEALRKGIPSLIFDPRPGIQENTGPTSLALPDNSSLDAISAGLRALPLPSKTIQEQARHNSALHKKQMAETIEFLESFVNQTD